MLKLPSYKKYREAYINKAIQLSKYGRNMYARLYGETEFYIEYSKLKEWKKWCIVVKALNAVGNVTRDLVNRQAYKYPHMRSNVLGERAVYEYN